MTDLFAPLSHLIAGLGNPQSAAVLPDQIALVKEHLALVEKRYVELEEENADLVKRLHELRNQMTSRTNTQLYTEFRGAVFERTRSGAYSKVPRCPKCDSAMFSIEDVMEFTCGKPTCGHSADFTRFELDSVLKELDSL